MPFVIYADFEAALARVSQLDEDGQDRSYTKA